MTMTTEVAKDADFSTIRYGQCWEDADVLLGALQVRAGDHCFSVASAGDNSLALLARAPERVLAVDLNPAQLACLGLRVAAYRCLDNDGLLELLGARPSTRRRQLYRDCRPALDSASRRYWDRQEPAVIEGGIGSAGKFERYFNIFRTRILPLVHSRQRIARLLEPKDAAQRRDYHNTHWNTRRWRLLFRLFFSRRVMGKFGRDPRFFQYVQGPVADRIHERVEQALTELDPSQNPYLRWILTGTYGEALPFHLRPENIDLIRRHLDALEWRYGSVESTLAEHPGERFHQFNLSDIFEYMSEEAYADLLGKIVHQAHPGARLAYWNMLAPRTRPAALSDRLHPLNEEAAGWHRKDKAFFYSRFVLEEVVMNTNDA